MHKRLRILAIGDELLFGKHVDTNSATISRRLLNAGLVCDRIRLVVDDEDQIIQEITEAADGADLVVITGGLGPTDDDRTRHALARAMGSVLKDSAVAWRRIEAYINKIRPGRPIAAANRRQALVPQGAKLLVNDRGTAPGLLGRVGSAWVACLPGVPHEMVAMLDRLANRLPKLFPDLRQPAVEEMHLAGIGESNLQDQLGDLAGVTTPTVGITAHEIGHITIRLVGSPSAVKRHAGRIRRVIGDQLLPAAGLADSLIHTLTKQDGSITTAESCTCGMIATMIGKVPGASAVLREALVAYHNEIKADRLGVSAAVLKRHGAVSEPVIRAMAEGARQRAGATLALATSGIAGPDGGTRSKPVGTVWLAAAIDGQTLTRKVFIPGTRERIQGRAAAQALLLGWQALS